MYFTGDKVNSCSILTKFDEDENKIGDTGTLE